MMNHIKKCRLIIVIGLPGCGKSSLIYEILKQVEMKYISTDSIWIDKFAHPKYSASESEAVFSAVLHDTEEFIKLGVDTVVEGVFATRRRLDRILEIVSKYKSIAIVVGVHCGLETAALRMIERNVTQGGNIVDVSMWTLLQDRQGSLDGHEGIVWLNSDLLQPEEMAQIVLEELSEFR